MDKKLNKYIPQIGDTVFFRTAFDKKKPLTAISVAIRPIAKVKFNHVENIGMKGDKFYSFGAIDAGYKARPYLDVLDGKYIMIKRPNYQMNKDAFNKDLTKLENRGYDFKGLLIVQLLYNLFRIWLGAKTAQQALKRLYCYEAYWYLFRRWFGILWFKMLPRFSIHVSFTDTIYEGYFCREDHE